MIDLREQISFGGVSRHETFTPRYGWLKKGFDAIVNDSRAFNAPDAIERLGVGKNMVRSIRSWCLAFHLIEPYKSINNKGQKGALGPTKLGIKLLSNNGWDPYLEDISSLWLLHWNLFIPPFEASSWPLTFNYCSLQSFDHKQLTRVLISSAKQHNKLSGFSEDSFDKDASCLIRMYSDGKENHRMGIDCPFTQIGLIRSIDEQSTFRFVIGEKYTLPSLIFAASCFSYAKCTQPNQRTLSFHKILYEFNSPGITFKVTETEAGRMLDDAAKKIEGVEFVESMGNRQLQFDKNPEELFWQILLQYYEQKPVRSIKMRGIKI